MSRILIADDETIETKALEMMIHNDFPEEEVLPSAANGPELIARIETYHPDVVITDINMPGLSGLDAMEMIRGRHREMKIIISTAYSDFGFLKRAMDMGASDYILKPLSRQAFQETLGKVLRQLGAEQRKAASDEGIRKNLGEMNEIVGDELLSSLLLGEPSENSFEVYRRGLKHPYCGTIVMIVRFPQKDIPAGRDFYRDQEQRILKALRRYLSCVGKAYRGELYFLLFPAARMEEQERRDYLTGIVNMLETENRSKAADQPWQREVGYGFSSTRQELEEIVFCLNESRLALHAHGRGGVFFYQEKEVARRGDPFGDAFEQLWPLLRQGRIEEAKAAARRIFQRPEVTRLTEQERQMYVLEKMLPVFCCLEEQSGCRYLPGLRIPWEELGQCHSAEETSAWTVRLLEQCAAGGGSSGSSEYVERALLYMQQHYGEDLSLEMVAEKAGISTFYLSRLFKQELKRTFVELLTDIRMEKSLGLMKEGSYSVREIAEKTGYRNVTYFYKVFRRHVGIGAGELRDFLAGERQDRS